MAAATNVGGDEYPAGQQGAVHTACANGNGTYKHPWAVLSTTTNALLILPRA